MAHTEDRADRHVARWRDHWLDIDFDDEIEAITVRIGSISKFFDDARAAAASEVGLADFEYKTLHMLMIRDTPGHASPTALAKDLDISPAGMTGRLDSMEKAGWVRRTASVEDRRKISVEATKAGIEIWRRAMDLRGEAETRLLQTLSPERRTELAALLKEVTLRIEAEQAAAPGHHGRPGAAEESYDGLSDPSATSPRARRSPRRP